MEFQKNVSLEFKKEMMELCKGLSAVVCTGDNIWVANDESISLERFSLLLQTADCFLFGDHQSFKLTDFITLPAPLPDAENRIQEIDIEGLDFRDSYLWLIGSHSLKRHKPNPEKDTATKSFDHLAKITSECNRYMLARIPVSNKDGLYSLENEVTENGIVKKVAQMACTAAGGNEVTEALKTDRHLAKFLEVPSKDNGFDIEGLAVGENNRVFIGLRGPVLRGYAVIIELQIEISEAQSPELKLQKISAAGLPDQNYRKHFLYLNGLGVRDLYIDGHDLLILAGPTMDLDGPVVLYRWKDGTISNEENIIPNNKLEKLGEIPFGNSADHAEGITAFPALNSDLKSFLVVYDAVSEKYNVKGSNILKADVFSF